MRLNLQVPFAEKDEAKKLGARWDPARKLWYVADVGKAEQFARWSPQAVELDGAPAPARAAPAKAQQAAGKRVVGSAYRAVSPACACLPWQECPVCAGLLAAGR